MPKDNATDTLIKSLYSFVKDEADNTRKEFKAVHLRIDGVEKQLNEGFDEVDGRFDRLEHTLNGHENRISNLEDSSRIVKTKLGLT